jgi:hypothetical protein
MILTSETLLTNQHPLRYTTIAVSIITAVFAVPSATVIVVTAAAIVVITTAAVFAVATVTVSVIAAVSTVTATAVCKGNLTILRRLLHLDLAKGNPK